MIPKECKRLAEADFAIAVVSKHSAREKSMRRGIRPRCILGGLGSPQDALSWRAGSTLFNPSDLGVYVE